MKYGQGGDDRGTTRRMSMLAGDVDREGSLRGMMFAAWTLAAFVVMLTWHNVWMASHGRELAADVTRVGQAVRAGSRSIFALGIVCSVAVMREGSEIALFMYGLVAAGGSTTNELLIGSLIGLAAGVGVTALTYLGLAAIPQRRLFSVTTALISLLAAGLLRKPCCSCNRRAYSRC